MHESLISPDEVRLTRDYGDHFRVLPARHSWTDQDEDGGRPLPEDFVYRSDSVEPLTLKALRAVVLEAA
jgi:hypothetical protein